MNPSFSVYKKLGSLRRPFFIFGLSSQVKTVIVIPARMGSTRFPGKPLVHLAGKPMVEWVYRAALAAECADEVVIATPDQEILDAAKTFGAPAVLTRQDHPSGTDRLAEVAESVSADVYVNLQGDEPLIDSATIRACAKALQASSSADASSVYAECSESELDEPSAVKVVLRSDETALYFSRFSLPYPRNPRELPVWKHIGIYAYRPETLRMFVALGPSPLELTEGLEQLRLLENGLQIQMVKGVASPISVDTPEQAVTANELLLLRGA